MNRGQLTRDRVLQAAEGAATLSEVARRLGYKGKISGSTGRRLRSIAPELDGVLRRYAGASPTASSPEAPATCSPDPDPVFRKGSMYERLFQEGSKRYWDRDELIEHVAALTGKSTRCVGYAVPVLANPRQRSNQNRSVMLKDEAGRITFVKCRKRR